HSARSGSSGSEIGSRSGFGVRVLAFSGSWFYRSAGQPEDQQPKNHGELETQNPEPRTRTPNPEPNPMPALIFRKGLDLKHAVAGMLADNYHSDIIDQIKAEDFTYRAGRLTIHLAREFGFCYGVDRAVDYAYQTRERFPDRAVFLTG